MGLICGHDSILLYSIFLPPSSSYLCVIVSSYMLEARRALSECFCCELIHTSAKVRHSSVFLAPCVWHADGNLFN